jgi:glutamate N-acetyltransferase/amino-acid N-acetyltransferase
MMSKSDLPTLHPVPGFRLGVACAGIKKPGRRDVVVMEAAVDSTVAAVFTRNAFCAAPVVVAKRHLGAATPRYLLVNTGNANAGTGSQGLQDAEACCQSLAGEAHCQAHEVLPFSTGVIGEPLPVDKIQAALPTALGDLQEDNWANAAWGILTTDTVPKGASRIIDIDGRAVTLTGICKGSGMIRPDMATMLAYVATDASIPQDVLRAALTQAVDRTFNRITVDGDMSTNDACVLVATSKSEVSIDATESPAYEIFCSALTALCEELAKAMVRDGEGATKLVTIRVQGGRDEAECIKTAYEIAHSPLVKTALFASDPNWGRILAVVGRAGIEDLLIDQVEMYLDDVCIVRNGGRATDYTEEQGQRVMSQDEITIRITLGRGEAEAQVWTCDFSYDYVRINAEYRT